MTSQETAIALTKSNLHAIFSEKDITKRLQAISSLWVSLDALFIDPLGVFKSHQAISDMVDKIQSMGGPEDVFTELSEWPCLLTWDEC